MGDGPEWQRTRRREATQPRAPLWRSVNSTIGKLGQSLQGKGCVVVRLQIYYCPLRLLSEARVGQEL